MKISYRHIYPFSAILIMSLLPLSCVGIDESVAQDSLSSDEPGSNLPDILLSCPSDGTYMLFRTAYDAIDYMHRSDSEELFSRGILPQMTKDEFDYAVRLLNSHHRGFIIVDKDRMKVVYFNKYGVEERSYGMACGKNYGTKHKKSDSRTPEGFFSVKKVHNSTDWRYVDDNGVVSTKKGEFGPRFIRLNIPGTTQIGIHGTCAPWSIGGRRSHGCIRILNDNVMELVTLVDSGMPVIITPGRRDMAVNLEEGYDIPSISSLPGRPKLSPQSKDLSNGRMISSDTTTIRPIAPGMPNDSTTVEAIKPSIDECPDSLIGKL